MSKTSKVVFIWGDSHAQQLNYGLSRILPHNFELLQVASSGCVVNLYAVEDKNNYCEYSNWFSYNVIRELVPDVIIIGQNLGHDLSRMENISFELKRLGVKRVIFTGPSPHWVPSLPAVVARFLPIIPRRTYFGIDKGVMQLDAFLKSVSHNSENYQYVSLIDYFCNSDGCLIYFDNDLVSGITSHDYGHLSSIASYNLAKDWLGPVVFGR